jgi:hypothetical protein
MITMVGRLLHLSLRRSLMDVLDPDAQDIITEDGHGWPLITRNILQFADGLRIRNPGRICD